MLITSISCWFYIHVESESTVFAAVVVLLVVLLKQRKPYLLLRPCDPIVAPV